MTRVVCFVELDADGVIDASLRALSLARGISPEPASVMALLSGGPPPDDVVQQLQSFGVSSAVFPLADGIGGYAPLLYARALESLAAADALAVAAAATDHGNEVLAHLASVTERDFVANCTDVRLTAGGEFEIRRHRWGGSLLEQAVLRAPLGLFTVATDAVAAVPAPLPEPPEVQPLAVSLDESEAALQAVESRPEASGVSLASARVVVSGGRGVGGPEGFAIIEELAGLLGGAVGVSRVVTSLGWRPHREQVGQTGTKVTPELYMACGISGAIQHLAGCQSAKHMIAINLDPDAPIMSRADWAVIGDVSEVLPALVGALRERRSAG